MQSDEIIKNALDREFNNVRPLEGGGFKFNKKELTGKDIVYLSGHLYLSRVSVKRSGTGVVVIINSI